LGSRTGYADDAVEMAQPETKSLFREYAETILVCVIFVIFSRTFVFQQSKIPSGSMETTLLNGDYIMVNRFIYPPISFEWARRLLPRREIRRDDIVVFKFPQEPETDYIKRVVGLPGDTIELIDGYLYVNGERQAEPWIQDDFRYFTSGGMRLGFIRDVPPVTVEPGKVFVMGDHRNSSRDSREWGQLPMHLIKGRALLIWWSFEEQESLVNPTFAQLVRSWGRKLVFFFTGTRWSRCFSLIR